MRYYDPSNKRLVFIDQHANPDFWDQHWELDENIRDRLLATQETFVSKVTKQYIQPGDGSILEGGCGWGQHVSALVKNGYHCIGVDNAPETVAVLQKAVPELDIRLGDIQRLDFETGTFSGYWSLGVIEHFWEGYQVIGEEMSRLVRLGGYLFLAFPAMSPLRRLKARLGLYPSLTPEVEPPGFYQFALDPQHVRRDFHNWGFRFVKAHPYAGLKGFKSEVKFLHPWLQSLYDYRGPSFLLRSFRAGLSALLTPWAQHGIIMIFKREG